MKKIITLAIIITSCICTIHAQDDSKLGGIKFGKKDALLLNIYTDIWQKTDSLITISPYSPGFDIYAMYSIPFGKSKFSLGLGFGVGTHNLRSDAVPTNEINWTSDSLTGRTIFALIPSYKNNKEIKYDNNKFTLSYFDIPLELRYKKENKKGKMFKFSVGGKVGCLLSSHTKYRGTKYEGDDPDVGTADVKYKIYKIQNLELLRYGISARIGFGMYNIFGYYSLSKLFQKDKGPELYPISVGICITPL
jgi:hypothetical protein